MIEQWHDFFIMVGSGAVALTGLIFVALSVALSLKFDNMIKDATHKYRSINTLAGLTAVFVSCGLVLMPGQTYTAVGIELFIISLVAGIIFLYGFHEAFKFGSHPSKLRLIIGTCLFLAEAIGSLMLVYGSIAGLYIAAVSMVLNVAFMISAAWLLVVGVYNKK